MEHRVERASRSCVDRRMSRRDEADFVLSMAGHLSRRDQVLIDYIYGQGKSVADYARLVRCNFRTAQQRIQSIIKRIYSKNFQYLIAHEPLLPREYRAVARRLILEGRGLRNTARLTGRSLHQVRRQHLELLVLLEAQSRAWSAGDPVERGVQK
ncbi:MAG: hypothetical protein AAF333_13560 [Planctomycetota bacterium]